MRLPGLNSAPVRFSNISGFALIEMIGVMAIIAILAGAMAPFLLNQIDTSEADAEQIALDAIMEGIRSYYLDENAATYGSLPPILGWQVALVPPPPLPNYVGTSAADLTRNNRDVARLYLSNNANLTTVPQVTIASHLIVGGAAGAVPAAFANGCIGSARGLPDPCNNSPGDVTDDMGNGIPGPSIKVANLNLAKERDAIIQRVRTELLAPFVAVIESSVVLDCPGINVNPPNPVTTNINASTSAALTAAAATMTFLDYWGNTIQVTKASPNTLTVWSTGPGAALLVPPANPNPLFLTATCPSFDVNEQLSIIADTVVGAAVAQNPFGAFPATLAAAGVTNANDPWGTVIVYAPAATSFTLTSLGPDLVAGGGDDIVLTKSANELNGLYAAMGRGFGAQPVSPSANYANCAAVDGWMTGVGGCDTGLGYLINASDCNIAIAYDQECTVSGY